MPGTHVALHRRHTPGRVSIVIAGCCHTVVFTNMVVQCGVVRRPEFTEGTEPYCDSAYPVSAHLVAPRQCFLCV